LGRKAVAGWDFSDRMRDAKASMAELFPASDISEKVAMATATPKLLVNGPVRLAKYAASCAAAKVALFNKLGFRGRSFATSVVS